MKDKWEKIIEQLEDDEYIGIEYLLRHLIFAVWILIILSLIGYFLG